MVTIYDILKINGLVKPQKRCKRVKPLRPLLDTQECNEVWSAGYKGIFLMGNNVYRHPLTIADSRSLNHFVKEYNHIRPHEVLGMETPDSMHNSSNRPYPEKIPKFGYRSNMKIMKVC